MHGCPRRPTVWKFLVARPTNLREMLPDCFDNRYIPVMRHNVGRLTLYLHSVYVRDT